MDQKEAKAAAGATARDYVAAMERQKRAEDTLTTAQSGLERANREVEVFRKKLLDLAGHQTTEAWMFLVGQKLVHVQGKAVLLMEPTVVDQDGRR